MLPFYAEEQKRAQEEDSIPTVRYPETEFRGSIVRSLMRLFSKKFR